LSLLIIFIADLHCIVLDSIVLKYLYSTLNSRGPTEALLVRLAPRKETSFKKW